MTPSPPHDPRAPIRFAESALQLLDQGGFTATYKYAVLLALMDLCLEGTGKDGAPPTMVTTRQLAEKVIDLYWPQTRPFLPPLDRPLSQTRGKDKQAKIVADIDAFQRADPGLSLHAARSFDAHADRWRRLVDDVEWTLILMPLPRLQTVGGRTLRLIYEIRWGLDIERQKADVRAYQRALATGTPTAAAQRFDNAIRFIPGAEHHLVTLVTARKQLEPFTAGLLTACRRRRCSAHLEVRLRSPPRQTARMLDGDPAPATCAP
ncbi:MAG: hypothetical protein H6745_05050 [Deltaproteobacteria bacterium]|nr:hypothetical protein [Deltaproteobacteria bacterium]